VGLVDVHVDRGVLTRWKYWSQYLYVGLVDVHVDRGVLTRWKCWSQYLYVGLVDVHVDRGVLLHAALVGLLPNNRGRTQVEGCRDALKDALRRQLRPNTYTNKGNINNRNIMNYENVNRQCTMADIG